MRDADRSLDLSAAFDCVDHALLLQRLQRTFGLSGTVLRWLTSFVSGRSLQVAYGGQLSPTQSVLFEVPQGSVLGPLLFVLYTADLGRMAANHRFILHQYADDCQVYTSTSVDDATVLQVSTAESRHSRRASPNNIRQNRRHST